MRITLPSGTEAEVVGESRERGLVLVPDIMGLRPLFCDMAAMLAEQWQCRVVAPDLYPGQSHLDLEGRHDAASALVDAEVLGDMTAAADATGADVVGAIGFCMGGMYVNKAVSTGRFHRLASFYGMINIPERWEGPGQVGPLDHLAQGDPGRLLAVIGSVDPYTRPEEVETLGGTGAHIAAYEGAGHGFVHDPTRPAYRADDATDAWAGVKTWLWS
ncbi:MAG: dienelactone hydrolase [Candidatus Aldehydirespiratoraceae bacterium]|jgi:dienelactone hydrolase